MSTPTTPPPLIIRPRRLRSQAGIRRMVRENRLTAADLIYPLFIIHGDDVRRPVPSMPGVFQLSIDQLAAEVEEITAVGVPAVILFGLPAAKDPIGVENFAPDGIISRAIREIKKQAPDLIVITDVCLCEYTDHGHCGILSDKIDHPHLPVGTILNDETLEVLAKVATAHGRAGADIVAPSGMIDGMVETLRQALDDGGFAHVAIMSYAVKYASAFYGPFRDAADGAPQFGDRKSHQMDPANGREALKEAALDIAAGADFIMVKPGLPYLDVVARLHDRHPEFPLVAYNVSGEYAMVKAAAQNGWLDEKKATLEGLLAFKRAGAACIITYHAKEAAGWLAEE